MSMVDRIWKQLRRRYIISPKFQWELTGYFVAVFIFSFGILYWGLNRSLTVLDQRCKQLAGAQNLVCVDLLAFHEGDVRRLVLMLGVVAVGFLFFGGIIVSHRISGPIYRFMMNMRQIGAGESAGPIKFRKNDNFQELAESFNRDILPLISKKKE